MFQIKKFICWQKLREIVRRIFIYSWSQYPSVVNINVLVVFFQYVVLCLSVGILQFSRSVRSDSLQPHESQHSRTPCPAPGVYSNSCPSSRWCHPAISSSYRPLLLLPPVPPSIRVFSNESALHNRWSKFWSFSFNISPSNEHPGLTSFRMDWLDLLAAQGTLKSLLQHLSC